MIKFENTEVVGWRPAIRGMRNPLNSWALSDSGICKGGDNGIHCENCASQNSCGHSYDNEFKIGKNDHNLMMHLRNAGTDHRKFMRMIVVYVDITAPLYWWKEFDTYKVGTVANSCSTMHKIAAKEFAVDDFSCDHLYPSELENGDDGYYDNIAEEFLASEDVLKITINALNNYRNLYLEAKDKKHWWQMIQLLPSSYNQRRTVMMSYEVLANIYKSRKNHKLDEWASSRGLGYDFVSFCDWIESLPYSELITTPIQQDTYISHHDRLVISAYTGYMLADFNDIHAFIAKTLGRPVYNHEFAESALLNEIHSKLENEWRDICKKECSCNG